MDDTASLAAGIPVPQPSGQADAPAATAAPAPVVSSAAPAFQPAPAVQSGGVAIYAPAAPAPAPVAAAPAPAPAAASIDPAQMAAAAEAASVLSDPSVAAAPVVVTIPGLTLDALPTRAQVLVKNYAQKGLVLVCAVLAAHGLPLSAHQTADVVQVGSALALFAGSCVWTWLASDAHVKQLLAALRSPPPAA